MSEDPQVPQKVGEGAPRLRACFVPQAMQVLTQSCHAALLFKLKHRALNQCSDTAKAYAECCRGRSISMAWACRAPLRDLNTCLQEQCVPCSWDAGSPEQA